MLGEKHLPYLLVVDDNASNLIAMQELLSDPRWSVVTADSGVAAMHLLLDGDFAVILLDVQMPGMDGFELAEHIRARPRFRRTPIIFMTAIYQSEEYARKAYSLGAVDYLFKPLIPEIVRAKVEFFVELYTLHRDSMERQRQEHQRRATELAEETQRLLREQRRRDLFMTNLSHELRTPLNSILGFAQLLTLEEKLEAETARRFADFIARGAENLTQLVRNMLEFVQDETLREAFQPAVVELRPLLAEVVEALRPMAVEKRMQVLVDMGDDVERGTVDARRLRQIVFNYLSNAIKFGPTGSHVTLTARRQSERALCIEVLDEGPGLSPNDAARLFVEFGKPEGPANEQVGAGLGLALSRHLVELHGGQVGVDKPAG